MTIKNLISTCALILLVSLGGAVRAETEMLDQVVAIVDDDVVMASELRDRLTRIKQNIQARGMDMPPEDELVRQTLDQLILESIQLQMGERVGVRISDSQLTGAMQRIAAQNGVTLEQFREQIEQQGQSYAAMREDVRQEMIIQRVQSGNVNQRIEISEEEIDNFLATEEGQELTQPQYRLAHALLPVSSSALPAEEQAAREHVEQLLARIRDGEPFDEVIASSTGQYTFSGGDLGWRKQSGLPSLFADIVPDMEVGEVYGPIRSDSGFHLIKLLDMQGGEMMVEQTKVQHILVKPSEIRTEEETRQLMSELRQRALDGEDFAELAREYSEDIGSAQEGGELGWVLPGQMVPEFEEAMRDTAVGEISEPVRSEFGWHILKVEDRRERDMSERIMRNKAREYLHNRKYQEELDAWLRRIRDEAFVDIK